MTTRQHRPAAATIRRTFAGTSPLYIVSSPIVGLLVGSMMGFGLAGCSSCSKRTAGKSADDGDRAQFSTPGAHVPTPISRAAYVTNNASDSISVIDRDGDTVTTVPIDLDPGAHEAPHHLAVDPIAGTAFVALAFPPEARKAKLKDPHGAHGNAESAGKVARLDLRTLAVTTAAEVDENPGDIVLTHDRARVLVTHFDMKRAMNVAARGGASPSTMFAHLVVLDAKTLKRIGSRPLCVAPHGIAVTRDDKTAFVACYGSDEIAVVDLSSDGFPTSRIPMGAMQGVPGVPRYGPYSATLSPDEAHVIVAELEGQEIRVLDRGARRFDASKTVPLAAKAFMPAFVGPRALLVPVQSPDGLVRIDLETSKVERRRSFEREQCSLPHVVRVASDGRVYLVCEGDHRAPGAVLQIDPTTLEVVRRWAVGSYPDGLDFGAQ